MATEGKASTMAVAEHCCLRHGWPSGHSYPARWAQNAIILRLSTTQLLLVQPVLKSAMTCSAGVQCPTCSLVCLERLLPGTCYLDGPQNWFGLSSAGKIHVRNTIEQLKLVGPRSMGVSLLTAGFVGMVFTIQVPCSAPIPLAGCAL